MCDLCSDVRITFKEVQLMQQWREELFEMNKQDWEAQYLNRWVFYERDVIE